MGPRHVEFVGLPGSGKTTLVNHLASTPNIEGYQLRYGYKVAVTRILFPVFLNNAGRYLPVEAVNLISHLSSVTHPSRHCQQNDAFLQTAQGLINAYTEDNTRRKVVREWVQDSTIQFSTASELLDPSEVILCDEGFLQRAIATFCPPNPAKEIAQNDIDSYVSAMPEPDIVIFLNVTDDTAITRMYARSSGPPDWINTDVTSRLEQVRNCIAVLKTVLQEKNINFKTFDNNGEMDKTYMTLTELMQVKG